MSDETMPLAAGVRLPLRELRYEYSRSGGPGGQHANKTSTKVTLRVTIRGADWVPAHLRDRLMGRIGNRLTNDGELLLHASEYRDRERNRAAALARLRTILRDALTPPTRRVKTKPTRGSIERRIRDAKHRGRLKKLRRKPTRDD